MSQSVGRFLLALVTHLLASDTGHDSSVFDFRRIKVIARDNWCRGRGGGGGVDSRFLLAVSCCSLTEDEQISHIVLFFR